MKLKRLLPIFLIFVIVFSIFRMVNPSAAEGDFVTTTALNVRRGPGTEYKKMGCVPKGTVLDTIEYKDGWYKINFKGNEGYVCGDYVKVKTKKEAKKETKTEVVAATYDGEDRDLSIAIFNKVNEYRASIGVDQLEWNEKLYSVAYTRAKEISTNWSHIRPDGTYPDTAFAEKGVKYNLASENLLRYVTNENDSFDTWYNSSTHRATMENGALKKSAVYVYRAPDGYIYVAQEFID